MEQLKPPTELKLTGNVEDHWRRFKQCFTLYLTAIGATEKTDEQRIALFLTIAGPEALDVFNSFQLTADEQKNYETVLSKFERTEVRQNVMKHRRSMCLTAETRRRPSQSSL